MEQMALALQELQASVRPSTPIVSLELAAKGKPVRRKELPAYFERIAAHPINRIEKPLPWNLIEQLKQSVQVTQALVA